jgi:hypothetical protein
MIRYAELKWQEAQVQALADIRASGSSPLSSLPSLPSVHWGTKLPIYALSPLVSPQKRVLCTLKWHGGGDLGASNAESIYPASSTHRQTEGECTLIRFLSYC